MCSTSFTRFALLLGLTGFGCGSAATDESNADLRARFTAQALPAAIQNGGYIDSTFINASADRIYFIHSIFSVRACPGSFNTDFTFWIFERVRSSSFRRSFASFFMQSLKSGIARDLTVQPLGIGLPKTQAAASSIGCRM